MSRPRYLLDTNVCIYIRRQRPPEVLARFRSLRAGEAVISVVTYGELRHGAVRSRDRARALDLLDQLATLLPVLPQAAGEAYGTIRPGAAR